MFDLSALDAELDSLGRAPENTKSLAEAFAGIALAGSLSARLQQVDAELSALSDGSYVPPARVDIRPARVDQAPAPRVHEPSGVVRVESSLFHAHEESREQAWDAPIMGPAGEEPPAFGATAHAEAHESEYPAHASSSAESIPPEQHSDSGRFAHAGELRAAALTESQEIVLPDPIAREELSNESGELSLSGSEPSSGSFELPDSPTEPRITTEDANLSGTTDQTDALLPFDDVQDALEGSQPIAVAGRPTLSPGTDLDRDPDAEFDALLSEATDPRGIPTVGASSEIDTDDLLRGLDGGDQADDDVSLEDIEDDQDAPHEADALTRSLYEDAGDSTEILDRASLSAIESTAPRSDTRPDAESDSDLDASLASLMTPDELDSGELEIIDDEPTLAPQMTPLKSMPAKPPPPKSQTARPGLSNKAPPPPPPSSNPEKRPSGGLLGRLFSKRDGE
jgi:hypothetical protein